MSSRKVDAENRAGTIDAPAAAAAQYPPSSAAEWNSGIDR